MKNPSVNITPTLNWLFPIVSHHSAKGSTAFYLPITWKLFCSVIVSSTSKDWHFILLRQELIINTNSTLLYIHLTSNALQVCVMYEPISCVFRKLLSLIQCRCTHQLLCLYYGFQELHSFCVLTHSSWIWFATRKEKKNRLRKQPTLLAWSLTVILRGSPFV